MTVEERLLNLKNNKIVDKNTLYQLISEVHPNYNDNSIRWVIYNLIKKSIISKLSSTQYIIGKKRIYQQQGASQERNNIVLALNKAFPDMRFVVYESTLLNEWVNHQIARKVIFIETEKYFMNDIFRFIYNKFPTRAILNPNKEDLHMYEGELILVNQLVSQAPINQKTRDIKIEKLLVDLYTKDLITEFLNEDEKENVIEAIFRIYHVSVTTIYAYAKRRNNVNIIKKVISSYESGGLL